MNEKFDYKNSLTDIKASLFDIYEDQEKIIGGLDSDDRDKHVSDFIEIKDLAVLLLDKIQKLYSTSDFIVNDDVDEGTGGVSSIDENDTEIDNDINTESSALASDLESENDDIVDVEGNLEDDTNGIDISQSDDNNDDDDDESDDAVRTLNDNDNSVSDDSQVSADNDNNEDDISFDNSSSSDNLDFDENKYYLLCDENKLHFAYASQRLIDKISNYHLANKDDDNVSDSNNDESDNSKLYKKDELPVKGIIVRNDQYMKLALSKHRQEGVLKEAKVYRIETVKRKRQEQQKIELEKAKVHLDI